MGIFVFGSNLRGIHGAGAAKYALDTQGARWGIGEGLEGNSYALPTKDYSIQTLPLKVIQIHVDRFLEFAQGNLSINFDITRIGCGLAGYTDQEIAPMFLKAPINCYFPQEWHILLGENFNYHNMHG